MSILRGDLLIAVLGCNNIRSIEMKPFVMYQRVISAQQPMMRRQKNMTDRLGQEEIRKSHRQIHTVISDEKHGVRSCHLHIHVFGRQAADVAPG
ncbi:hypothetical protein AAFF_G00417460 [Aldrovandia affinis]|uniref:Uncharacterized protein n=1 Tax=Aldrovandia affinis TaxID=143900 RepID=A0AAD7VXX3_9TELE|nr:hypothetical protein AAFF_G00088980 [Aldrovandia affinis]KAJ8398838.1 hypothetical protein AAFF_G00417460 [Aldrovandia affinis]